MNLRVSLMTILAMLAAQTGGSSSRLPNCPQVDVVSTALKNINAGDWAQISPTELLSMWPTELPAIDCDADGCKTLRREDRLINNECQCCEIFHFDVDRDDKGAVAKLRLHSIVLYYSESSRKEALSAAKILAQALGLAGADVGAIGRKPVQSFDWFVDRSRPKEVVLMEVRTVHRQGTWTVFIHVSRHLLVSPSQNSAPT